MRSTSFGLVTATLLMGGALPADAGFLDQFGIHSLGSEMSLSYGQLDSGGDKFEGPTYTSRSTYQLGNSNFGAGFNSGSSWLKDDAGGKFGFQSSGLVLFYQVSPDVRIGAFGDFGKIKSDAIPDLTFNAYGIEASYVVAPGATISGYAGQLDSKDLTDLGNTFGIRSDVALTNRLSVFGAYYSDDLGLSGTLSGGNIGASYSLATVYDRDIRLNLIVGRYDTDGTSVDTVGVGISVPLFSKTRDPQGWQGGLHSGYANLLTSD